MLAGLFALEVTTSTPDALCPPLEEARAAIEARVGEVRGAYRAEFALIRRSDGRHALELVLQEGEQELLHRELPLDDAGCQDAAQAMALVLERYFDAVEMPRTRQADQDLVPVPPTTPIAVRQDRPAGPADSKTPRSRWRGVRARAGLLHDLELGFAPLLGLGVFPEALRATPRFQFGVMFDIAAFLKRDTEVVRAATIEASTLQGAIALPFAGQFGALSAWVGPWAQLRFQRAGGPELEDGKAGYRSVPGVGGAAQLGWVPARDWTLGLGFAGGAQLAEASSRFVLLQADGERDEVLAPRSWFGQTQLTLAVEL